MASGSDQIGANSSFNVFSFDRPQVRDYKKRKAHQKVKTGCLTCRTKRCDEARPFCSRCQKNGRLCKYSNYDQRENSTNIDRQIVVNQAAYPVSLLSAVDVLPYSTLNAKNVTPPIHLLSHLHRDWIEIFSIENNNLLAELFCENSLVRNSLLAISACHMRHLSPHNIHHQLAQHQMQAFVFQEYQRALSTPREKYNQTIASSIMLGALVINMLNFMLHETGNQNDISSSWVFSDRNDRLGWVSLQAGVRPLLFSLGLYMDTTLQFLGPIFLGNMKAKWPPPHPRQSLQDVPPHWVKGFELDGLDGGCDIKPLEPLEQAKTGEILRPLIEVLVYLRGGKMLNVFANLQFLSKISPGFRKLLFDREPRSLWILGYWLGLMHRFNGTWWCTARVKRDYRAIRVWLGMQGLEQRPGDEGEVWRLFMREYDDAPFWFDQGISEEEM